MVSAAVKRASTAGADDLSGSCELLEGKSDSPMAIIDDLVDMEIFERDPAKTVAFDEFLHGVVVISLDPLGQDDRSKNMLVAMRRP